MNPDSDTLVTALYVTVDGLLVAHPPGYGQCGLK